MTAAAQRLERRSDLAPRRPDTNAQSRPVTRAQTRPVTRAQTRPVTRAQTRPVTRAQTRPQSATTSPTARARRVQPVAAPRPLTRRASSRPLPADLAALAQVQVFRPRVESETDAHRRHRPSLRNHLREVPRRRRIAAILAPALVLVFLAMLGITTFQTRMAEDQVQLDRLLVKVDKARALQQTLERQQAELRSPVRLGREASRLNLVSAEAVGFVEVDAATYRTVLTSSAGMSLEDPGTTP